MISIRLPSHFLARSVAIAAAWIVSLASSAGAQNDDGWHRQVTVYGWASGFGGDLTPTSRAPTLSFDKSFSDVLEDLDSAFFVSGFARRGNFVMLGDLTYSSSSKEGLVPPGIPARGELTQRSLTLAAGQRIFSDSSTSVDLLAGIRAWKVKGSVAIPLGGIALSPEKSFVDPIVALRANVQIAPKLSLIGYLDAGGFGVGSDRTFQVAVTANYQLSERLFISGGYRQLYLDYDNNGTSFEGKMGGPVIGLTLQF